MKRSDIQHIMIDLETLGTGPSSLILSCGIACMDHSMNIVHQQEWLLNWRNERQLMSHFQVDYTTFLWWLQQNQTARERICQSETMGAVTPLMFVEQFNNLLDPETWAEVFVWGNGAGFDQVILEHLITTTNNSAPWKFWNSRCFRTMRDFAFKAYGLTMQKEEDVGAPHVAVDDAVRQARHLKLIMRKANLAI